MSAETVFDVQITVRLRRERVSTGETERMRYVVPGTLTKTERGVTLRYEEPKEKDAPAVGTVLSVENGVVSLEHTGGVQCFWLFDTERVRVCPYAFGPFATELLLQTESVETDLTANGGKLYLEYYLNRSGERDYTLTKMEFEVRRR